MKIPFEYAQIALIIEGQCASKNTPPSAPVHENVPEKAPEVPAPTPVSATAPETLEKRIPKALADLMTANGVSELMIQTVVAQKGYFPADMPLEDYPEDFVNGVLIGAWDQVYDAIKKQIDDDDYPF